MRIELSTQRPNGLGAPSGLSSQWRVGAIVEALAVRGADGQLWLNIGATRVPARIASGDAAGPADGERLQLRVLRDSPVVALESVFDDQEANLINEGLRRFVPRQTSSVPLFQNLAWLAERNAPMNRAIADAAQRLWRALPNAAQLTTPEGLETAMQDSGAFLEARLAQTPSSALPQLLARDLKALLASFKQTLVRAGAVAQRGDNGVAELPSLHGPLAALNAAPASLEQAATMAQALNALAGQTEGALARLNTLQLVNAEANGTSAWLFEIPFVRDGRAEVIRFRFESSGRDPRNGEQDWSIEAALNLDVGALHARVSLHGARVAVQLRSNSHELVSSLQANANELVAALEEVGLQVEHVQCLHGLPHSRETDHAPHFAAPLLDVRV